jgi:hypothetical protein
MATRTRIGAQRLQPAGRKVGCSPSIILPMLRSICSPVRAPWQIAANLPSGSIKNDSGWPRTPVNRYQVIRKQDGNRVGIPGHSGLAPLLVEGDEIFFRSRNGGVREQAKQKRGEAKKAVGFGHGLLPMIRGGLP